MDCGVVAMVPVHAAPFAQERIFVLLCVTVLAVKASAAVPCVAVRWVACAAVCGVSCTY